MPYSELTYKSSKKLKKWTHQKRFDDALSFLNLSGSDTLLDYGCGDGYMLELSLKYLKPDQLFGFEPADGLFEQAQDKLSKFGVKVYKNTNDLPKNNFSYVTCFETCEHLMEKELEILFKNINNVLRESGKAVISVPVEIGVPSLAKNIFRIKEYGGYDNLNFINFIKSLLGLKVKRKTDQLLDGLPFIYSHVGFDYRHFTKKLTKYFDIKEIKKSPFSYLPKSFNNTIYYICEKKNV